jgi:hypothetical protein
MPPPAARTSPLVASSIVPARSRGLTAPPVRLAATASPRRGRSTGPVRSAVPGTPCRSNTQMGGDLRCCQHDGRSDGWLAGADQDCPPDDAPVLGLAVVVFRGDRAKDAELLVLRHENGVLRRHVGRVRYEPSDRALFAALARLLPRRRWTEVFPVTPAALLAWHRELAAKKYDTSNRRKPGRPPTAPGIACLVVRLAKESPLWDTAGSTAN